MKNLEYTYFQYIEKEKENNFISNYLIDLGLKESSNNSHVSYSSESKNWIVIDGNGKFKKQYNKPNSNHTRLYFQEGELQNKKKPSPIQRMKDIFNLISEVTGVKFNDLNQAKERSHYIGYETHYKKGIRSEFIRIYELSKDLSFAFSFNNMKGKLEDLSMTSSIKYNNQIFSIDILGFENIRFSLKELIKDIENSNLNSIKPNKHNGILKMIGINKNGRNEIILESIDRVFNISNNKEVLNEVDLISNEFNRINKTIVEKIEKLNNNIKELSSSEKNLKFIKKDSDTKIAEYKKELGLDEMESKLAEAKSKLSKFANDIHKVDGGSNDQKAKIRKMEKNLKLEKESIIFKVEREIDKKIKPVIRESVLAKYKTKDIIQLEKNDLSEFELK